MSLDQVLKIVQIVAYIAGGTSAVVAVCVSRRNARRERAQWLENLYARFYENKAHTGLREILDKKEPGSPEISNLVSEEKSEWTNYLNFFEFVAYLQKSDQLTKDDVDALFRYPLRCLKNHPEVLAYICDQANDYQRLKEKLAEDE